MRTSLITPLIILLFNSFSFVVLPQDKIVEGASEFLIERANDNLVYIFEEKIKENKILKTYLPRTYSVISSASIQTLLTNSRVWKESVKSDIDSLYSQVWLTIGRGVTIFPENKVDALEEYLPSLQTAKLIYNGKNFPLNSVRIDDPPEVKSIINNISFTYDSILNLLKEVKNELSIKSDGLITDIISRGPKNIEMPVISNIDALLRKINEYNILLNSKNYKIKNRESLVLKVGKVKPFLDDVVDVIRSAQILTDTSYSFSYRIINSFIIVEYLIKWAENLTGDRIINSDDYDNYFEKFKRYSLFFAQLSDANSVDQVKNILRAATVPAVSFGLKRNERELHFAASSYLGLSLGLESINGFGERSFYGGLSTPVGLEFSYGLDNKASLCILFSILDFGPPINSKLYNSDIKYKLLDLIQPGIYLVYGIKDLPLAIMLGYYNGKGYKLNSMKVNHFNISFVFDMPLILIL